MECIIRCNGDHFKAGAAAYSFPDILSAMKQAITQVRVQVLNEDMRSTFERWYPAMTRTDVSAALVT